MITTLHGQDFADTKGRLKAVLIQNLDEHSPLSPISSEEIYRVALAVIRALERENVQLRKNIARKRGG